MARRAGKAASRKARQRSAQRTNRSASAPRPAPAPAPADPPSVEAPSVIVDAVPPVGTPDAREAASLTPTRRVTPPLTAGAATALTDRERAEFHYVERDLRSLGILTAIMAALLLAAWAIFQALGITT